MIQWGRTDGYVTLVDIIGQLVGRALCAARWHKPGVRSTGGKLIRACDRCGKPL